MQKKEKRIIQREITNEDGDFYGVCGNITRFSAYRIIRQDLRNYGILEDIEFTIDDLVETDFWETTQPDGEEWTWWEKPKASLKPRYLGRGWGIYQ